MKTMPIFLLSTLALGCGGSPSSSPQSPSDEVPTFPSTSPAMGETPATEPSGAEPMGDPTMPPPAATETGALQTSPPAPSPTTGLAQPVFFELDSAELRPDAKQRLQEELGWMRENPKRHVVIHGFASEEGTPSYNLTLGNNRANAIRKYFVAEGIEIGRISVVSHGEGGPKLDPAIERRSVFVADRPAPQP